MHTAPTEHEEKELPLAHIVDHLVPVYRAETLEEKEAIYRFRYDVYVTEMQRYQDNADHQHGWLKDADDEAPYSILLYCGSPEKITATARVCIWNAGEIPKAAQSRLSTHLVPGIEGYNTAEVTRFMVSPTTRGRFLLPSLIIHGYEYLAGETGSDLAFFQSIPALVPHFRRLGTRPYGGALLDGGSSTLIPSVMVLSDYRYFKQCGSFLALFVKKYFFGPDKRKPLNTEKLETIFQDNIVPVELDALRVWDDVQTDLLKDSDHISNFLDKLAPAIVEEIAKAGMILKVPAGSTLTKEGTIDRQMYLVLNGKFEVFANGKSVAVLVKGDLFGEMAFFRKEGKRTATVKSVIDSKVLVISHSSLKKLMHKTPEGALQIFTNIGQIMSDRLAGMLMGG